jgi:hypothetical protein
MSTTVFMMTMNDAASDHRCNNQGFPRNLGLDGLVA